MCPSLEVEVTVLANVIAFKSLPAPKPVTMRTPPYRLTVFDDTEQCESQAGARLASAAPEMARLLMEFAYLDGDIDVCPWCADSDGPRGQHATDCRLAAALRKAGVFP